MTKHLAWLVPAALLACGLLATSTTASHGGEPTSSAPMQEVDPNVGNQMCVRCHEDVQQSMVDVSHGSGDAPEILDNGCQSCHGPGRLHVQSPDNVNLQPIHERLTLEEQDQLCTGCHVDMPAFDATHEVARISCSGCHVFHEREPDLGVMSWQPNCLSCHAGSEAYDELHEYDQAAMAEGTISCRSCHKQAHGE